MSEATTLFEKIWQRHLVRPETDETPAVLYIDLQLLHEVTSPQAFSELERRGLGLRRQDRHLATIDHSTPTTPPDEHGEYAWNTAQARTQVKVDFAQREEALLRALLYLVPNRAIGAMRRGSSSAAANFQWDTIFEEAIALANDTQSNKLYRNNGDGTYSYTFAQALTDYAGGPDYDETKTHRLGVEIRTNRGGFMPENTPANNAPYDFVPAGGPPTFERLIVDNDTCNACHDNLEFHGEARFDVEYCVTCHNPSSIDGDTVDRMYGDALSALVVIQACGPRCRRPARPWSGIRTCPTG